MNRAPAVANQFYPGDPKVLSASLEGLIPRIDSRLKTKALAVISPHAGYVYSGKVAGETFAKTEIPQSVIILGPNHQGYGAPAALMATGFWEMPMGEVPIDSKLSQAILDESSLVEPDDLAHRFEHSLEVQVPFLQKLRDDLAIAPIVLSHLRYSQCEALGSELAAAIRKFGNPTLIVASSDMTHYETRSSASAKDKMAIRHILALDPKGLYDTVHANKITMCGVIPATVALIAAIALGAGSAELIRYTDSGETSGDTEHVVGYAGIVISA